MRSRPLEFHPKWSHLGGVGLLEVPMDAPCIVHQLSVKRVLAAFFVHSQTAAINTHMIKSERDAPVPLECLVCSSSYVRSAIHDYAGDVGLTEVELLEHLNRPLLDHMYDHLLIICGIWTNIPACNMVRPHVELDMVIEHTQSYPRDQTGQNRWGAEPLSDDGPRDHAAMIAGCATADSGLLFMSVSCHASLPP